MFTAEPSDVAGYLGRYPRTVSEMSRRNLLRCKRLPKVGMKHTFPEQDQVMRPGSAADGTTMARAPLART